MNPSSPYSSVYVTYGLTAEKSRWGSLGAAWRIQIYTTLAIFAASLSLIYNGQGDLFHIYAGMNLAYLALFSVSSAVDIQSDIFRHAKHLRGAVYNPHLGSSRNDSKEQASSPVTAFCISVQFGALHLPSLLWYIATGIIVYVGRECTANDALPLFDKNTLIWWFFGRSIQLPGAWWLPFVTHLTVGSVWWAIGILLDLPFVKDKAHQDRPATMLLPSFGSMASQILCIEMSMAVDGVALAQENSIGYGQVHTPMTLKISTEHTSL